MKGKPGPFAKKRSLKSKGFKKNWKHVLKRLEIKEYWKKLSIKLGIF